MTLSSSAAAAARVGRLFRVVALASIAVRLVRRRPRAAPLAAKLLAVPASPGQAGSASSHEPVSISVVIPARDEAARIEAAITPLVGAPGVIEIVVVDDESTDDTGSVAGAAGARVLRTSARAGWAGKSAALQQGIERSAGEWVVMLDADTRPDPRLPLALVDRAAADGLDLTSGAGRVGATSPATTAAHAALLATLVARFGAPGGSAAAGRVLVSGQCLAVRRRAALDWGGFAPVADSTIEDVALARYLAATGRSVAFLDATGLLTVESYGSVRDTFVGWGRSLGLAGVDPARRRVVDVATLFVLAPLAFGRLLVHRGDRVDALALGLRFGILVGAARAFERRGAGYWLSPLLDPLAVGVLFVDLFRRRSTWRGRTVDRSWRPARTGARSAS